MCDLLDQWSVLCVYVVVLFVCFFYLAWVAVKITLQRGCPCLKSLPAFSCLGDSTNSQSNHMKPSMKLRV